MIRWTETALKHLEEIHTTISLDDPAAAARQCRLIYEAVRRLEAFPFAGRAGHTPNQRRLVVPQTPYLVYYRITKEAIFVRAIWHGAGLPPSLR